MSGIDYYQYSNERNRHIGYIPDMDKISYIVPCYNKERYIEECLWSIVNQIKSENIEIIFIDDASTDNSLKLAEKLLYLTEMDHKIIQVDENKGVGNALHKGFKAASGKYLCFLSADDFIINPYKTLNQYITMNENKFIDVSFYNTFVHGYSWESKMKNTYTIPSYYKYLLTNNHLLFLFLLKKNFIGSLSLMINKNSYYKFGEWDPSLRNVNDGDLILKYIIHGAIFHMIESDIPAVFYREYGDQLSHDTLYKQNIQDIYQYWKNIASHKKTPIWFKLGLKIM